MRSKGLNPNCGCVFRYTVKDRSPPGAKGITARITIDSSWTASQMHSRLVLLFRSWFAKGGRGQRFSFTYLQVRAQCRLSPPSASPGAVDAVRLTASLLQCTQGSRVLFAPDTPPEGWTGRHVLRISEHSALYILSHHEYLQVSHRSQCVVFVLISEYTCPAAS